MLARSSADAVLLRQRLGQHRRDEPKLTAAATVTATNTARQPKGTMSAEPVTGARIGDTEITSMTTPSAGRLRRRYAGRG